MNAAEDVPLVEHEDVAALEPEAWRQRLLDSIIHPVQDGRRYPGFPDEQTQRAFVGSAYEHALAEGFQFYSFVSRLSAEREPGQPNRYLDFGCGWGRISRFFLRDFDRAEMVAVDIDPDMVAFCDAAGVPGVHLTARNGERLPFEDGAFRLVTAYSVFTHLPEPLFRWWMRELLRVTAPGGLVVFTVEPERFLDFVASIDASAPESEWHAALAANRGDISARRRELKETGLTYLPTGGGPYRPTDAYGDTVVTPEFVDDVTKGLGRRIEYVDEELRFWQAVVVVKRNGEDRAETLGGLAPHKHVRADAGDTTTFTAAGCDPQMLWTPSKEDRRRLAGRSAIRVRIEMAALVGKLADPCIYVDWGDGFSEESRKALSLVGPGVYAATAHSNALACRRVRVDPSSAPCRFRVSRFSVEPASSHSDNVVVLSPLRRLARRCLRRAPRRVQAAARAAWRLLFQGRGGGRGRLIASLLARGSDRWRQTYVRQFEVARNLRSPEFAAPPLEPPRRDPAGPKVLAFYLPQYHPIPQNDAWWGRGFTEWTNVAKAVPQFVGHLQPRLPADLGYYDLRTPEVRRAQAELARRTGVDAFCFHYYWFAGRRLLEAPLDGFMADDSIELSFALCWANENWTRRWDGLESEVLIAQQHSPEDDLAVFEDMARYLRSPRYLRVQGRPLVVVYRPDTLPDVSATLSRWRARAREVGLGELFLVCTNAFGFDDFVGQGFDALVEFPPHAISLGETTHQVELLNPAFSGRVYDYEAVVESKINQLLEQREARRLPGVMPAWDNEARKPGMGHVFHGATPELFRRWISAAVDLSCRSAPPGERLIFVNAWNEWAEGAYLEPDRWFGHGFVQAVRAALERTAPRIGLAHPLVAVSHKIGRRREAVALVHIYYADLIEDFVARLNVVQDRLDVAVTFPDSWTPQELERLANALPAARLTPVDNTGRDVAPFLRQLRWAREAAYPVFCKLHSKRSPHLHGGDAARDRLLSELVGPEVVETALQTFREDPRLGLLAPAASEMRLGDAGVLHNNRRLMDELARLLVFRFDNETPFPAGTMFWGRLAAFERLLGPAAQSLSFEVEMGRIDGTLAHAMERAMAAIVLSSGHTVRFSPQVEI